MWVQLQAGLRAPESSVKVSSKTEAPTRVRSGGVGVGVGGRYRGAIEPVVVFFFLFPFAAIMKSFYL